jgi:hypothetical protein
MRFGWVFLRLIEQLQEVGGDLSVNHHKLDFTDADGGESALEKCS